MYVKPNFKTKKALIEAVKAGQSVTCFQPGIGSVPENGIGAVEGPWYPEPHRWYASVTMRNGKVIKVK